MTIESPYDAFPAVADYYDSTLIYLERKDVEFYGAEARASGGPVLELGCGTGRVLLPTARAGIDITGLDSSSNMLEQCRAKVASEPEEVQKRVQLVRGELENFDLGREFALITIPFRPFQHLMEVKQQLACLRSARDHLRAGGRLIFDVFHVDPSSLQDPSWKTEKEEGPATRLPDGRIVLRTTRVAAFHRAAQVNEIEFCWYVTHPNGRREQVRWTVGLRYYFRFELEHLLARAGLRVAALYGDLQRTPFRDDSPDMIFVAEKDAG